MTRRHKEMHKKDFHGAKRGPRSVFQFVMSGFRIGVILGNDDVRNVYRRTLLGPFWSSLGLGFQAATIGIIFSMVFALETRVYIPHIAVGLVVWAYLQSSLVDSCNAMIESSGFLQQTSLPAFSFAFRTWWKNLLLSAHNLSILGIALWFFGEPTLENILLALPGLVLLILLVQSGTLVLSLVAARFRDVRQIVSSVLTVCFYLTPVIWIQDQLPERFQESALRLNPFFHALEVIRKPLLDGVFPTDSITFVASFGTILAALSVTMFRKFHKQVVFWV